jgi:mono/diheme cytochrome c family protein
MGAARVIRRLALGILLAIVVLAGVTFLAVQWRWTRRFDAPRPSIAASADRSIVERGRYLVYGPAACAYCHVPREQWSTLDAGTALPLTGHHLFRLPFGDIYSANLTPDAATGIGRRTDGELARVLRYGVRADGRAAFPLMEFALSDEDLTAVISYLRSRPAIAHQVPEHQFTLLGKSLMAFAITPKTAERAAPHESPVSPSLACGEYLANHVSSCVACHTDRGPNGALVGPRFSGGQRMDVAADPTKVYVSPNLTPDPATSPLGSWSEDAFIARFRLGPTIPGTPMPWGAFARMTDDDLRSVYRYLRSLPPTSKAVGPPVQLKRVS